MIQNISDNLVFSALKFVEHGQLRLTNFDGKKYIFGHAVKYLLPDKKILIGSYHPSPRNVNTKRINVNKMTSLLLKVKKLSV